MKLEQKGSGVFVADVYSYELEEVMLENILSY